MKRITALFLILILILATGCEKKIPDTGNSDDTPVVEQELTLNLLYCNGDSVNPYKAITNVNVRMCQLLFDPLIKVDNSFNAVNALAESVSIDGTKCTVKLKSARFTDASAVTAEDVVYSFNLAKGSGTIYATQLESVLSASAADGSTVVFRMSKADPYFVNLLDFPVIKTGSDKLTDSDGVALPPIGCGRYTIDEAAAELNINRDYYGAGGNVVKIKLINAPDAESVSHYVEVGATDVYYTDLSDGNIIRMNGKRSLVPLNNLVYIGVNQSYGKLSNVYLRYAISAAVNRSRIVTSAYYGNATAATGIFHPSFGDAAKYQTTQTENNSKIAVENLEKIGYNNIDSQSYRINSQGSRLSLTLLVNSENQSRTIAADMIAGQLEDIGIHITVQKVGYSEYASRLSSGNYQLYLGEVRILNNMDITNLVVPGGSVAYGVTANTAGNQSSDDASSAEPGDEPVVSDFSNIADIMSGFYSGRNSIADVVTCVQSQMPVIPVCYRCGILFYDEDISGNITASLSDIFYSITSFGKQN